MQLCCDPISPLAHALYFLLVVRRLGLRTTIHINYSIRHIQLHPQSLCHQINTMLPFVGIFVATHAYDHKSCYEYLFHAYTFYCLLFFY
jgi:hypothetical protein